MRKLADIYVQLSEFGDNDGQFKFVIFSNIAES